MPTVFTRILNGEIPGTFVHRDELCAVIMSINPLAHGHALVIPVAEVEHWIDLDPALASHLFSVAHRIGKAQHEAFTCERVGLIIAGYEVPHTHLHVVPTNSMRELDFRFAAPAVEREDLERAAESIRTRLV